MKTIHRLGLAGPLVALALALASCGGAGGSAGGNDGSQGDTQRMSHGSMGRDDENTGGGMAGQEMARRMLGDGNSEYSDGRFIDMMVPHHQGAVEMAEVALDDAEHQEILQLSRNFARTQEAEIGELKDIKRQEFGTAEVPMETGGDQMRGMGMMMDPQDLSDERPFDEAFIEAMIPHHESAIDMANVALHDSDNPRIRELAGNIVSAQKREIAQMKEWRREWYQKD